MDLISLLGPLAPLAPLVNVPFIVAVVAIVQIIKKVILGKRDLLDEEKKRHKNFWVLLVLALGFIMAAIINCWLGWEGTTVVAKVAAYIVKGFLYACVAAYIYHRSKQWFNGKEKQQSA